MALAAPADVEDRLGRDLTTAEAARVAALLDDASEVVIGYCHDTFDAEGEEVPAGVAGVVAKMVARALGRAGTAGGEFAEQQSAGPFGVRYSADSSGGDMWLTRSDKLALRRYRAGGGVVSVQAVGERYEITEDG